MQHSERSLVRLLRCELTAVNQQFIHILSLRARGDRETADRIAVVDDVDFPNAMRIADHLIGTGAAIELEGDPFATGCSRPSMLAAEQAMENRMMAAIDGVVCRDPVCDRLVAAARAPRAAYARWLSERLAATPPHGDDGPRFGEETSELVSHLIALMEQSLVHALMHRHADDSRAADASWATSGAAMMHLMYLVRLLAREESTPVPGRFPALRIAAAPPDAPGLERALAAQTGDAAGRAATASDDSGIKALCGDVAALCGRLSAWTHDISHPAAETNPPAFDSFDRTYARYVAAG